MKKTNIITIILAILVIGLTGYIVYDKVLSKEETPNNNENTNINQNNNNNEEENEDEVNNLNTIKTYAGCVKEAKLPNKQGFEYAIYKLELKEEEKCVLHYGGIDSASGGSIMLPFDCNNENSYITVNVNDIPLYFKVNNNDTITYQNTNIVMKKVNSPESADYNFCKNNY